MASPLTELRDLAHKDGVDLTISGTSITVRPDGPTGIAVSASAESLEDSAAEALRTLELLDAA